MNDALSWLHQAVTWLLTPALLALLMACAIALGEAGLAFGERFWGLKRLAATGDLQLIQRVARHRLERADLLARIPPMLGLMATQLIDTGVLDPSQPVTTLIPELAGTAYRGATLRHLLDMRMADCWDRAIRPSLPAP